jgi:hypothetical protein
MHNRKWFFKIKEHQGEYLSRKTTPKGWSHLYLTRLQVKFKINNPETIPGSNPDKATKPTTVSKLRPKKKRANYLKIMKILFERRNKEESLQM